MPCAYGVGLSVLSEPNLNFVSKCGRACFFCMNIFHILLFTWRRLQICFTCIILLNLLPIGHALVHGVMQNVHNKVYLANVNTFMFLWMHFSQSRTLNCCFCLHIQYLSIIYFCILKI